MVKMSKGKFSGWGGRGKISGGKISGGKKKD